MTDEQIINDFSSAVVCVGQASFVEKCRKGENLKQKIFAIINRQKEEKKTMQDYIDCLKAENMRLHQNLQEAHIDIREQIAKNDELKNLLDDKCDRCLVKDRADAMKELAREIINDILPKYLYGRETQALQIGFAISEKVNELTKKR